MSTKWVNIQIVTFPEIPDSSSVDNWNNILAIHFSDEFSVNDYCMAVLEKITSINLSEISNFLDFQCNLVKKPITWLNKLDKLIGLNVEIFDSKKLEHRHTKLISQIDIKRESLKSQKPNNNAISNSNKKVACIAGEMVFSFEEVKANLETIPNIIEKKKYLKKMLHEYYQADPDIIYTKVKPFDKQVEAELKYIDELEELDAAIKKNTIQDPPTFYGKNKIKITCQLNQFVDMFFQLTREIQYNGKPILDAEPNDIAEVLSHCFVDKDNNALSIDSIKTILNPTLIEKRPKPNKQIDLKNKNSLKTKGIKY
jgi:hypothetical protein